MPVAKLLAATLTVTLTTADDAVWLVPYTAASLPARTRLIHGILIVLTLEFLVAASVVIAALFEHAVLTGGEEGNRWVASEDIILGSAGAVLCWTIAIFLFARHVLKNRRRRREAVERLAASVAEEVSLAADYGAVAGGDAGDSSDSQSLAASSTSGDIVVGDIPNEPSPWTVVSLTALGALDEVSYFPALLVGKVFSPFDLCFGTFLAAVIVLAVVSLFLVRCRPVLELFDKIPLYGIVTLFAIILTVEVLLDIAVVPVEADLETDSSAT